MQMDPVSPESQPRADDHSGDIAAIQRIAAVPSILDVACRVTGMGFAAVARVTDTRWITCAVRDGIAFGLEPGDELEIRTTICDEIRGHRQAIIIDHVAEDPIFRDHHAPRRYGFQSYISVPIVRSNGDFFGTLCAIDPAPAKLSNSTAIITFQLFAQLIALQLEADDELSASEEKLLLAEDAAELREQFIAVLGHDLRNPLAAIESGVRLIGRGTIDDRSRTILGMMQSSTRRMARLIDDVLDLARGRLGGGIHVIREVQDQLDAQLATVIDEMRATHTDSRIETAIEQSGAVSCDPARIAQLLSNLMSNALTHGDPAAAIRVTGGISDGVFRLSVINQGPPIPKDRRERLFRPFTRGEGGNPGKGLGLGLYIAAEIAKAHGGTIDVESSEAETRFTLSMPAA